MKCHVCFNFVKEPRVVTEGQQEEENKKLEEFRSTFFKIEISFLSTRSVDDISLTRCGHLFHTQCLQIWCLNEQRNYYSCPGCKQGIKLEEIIHVESCDDTNGHEEDLSTSSSSIDDISLGNSNTSGQPSAAVVEDVNSARAFQQLKAEHELLIFDFLERRKHFFLEQQKLMETNAHIEMTLRERTHVHQEIEKVLEPLKNLVICQQCPHCTSLSNSKPITPPSKIPNFQPNKLFVGGVECLQETRIFAHFSMFGEVVDLQWPVDSVTRMRRGFCFVEMSNQLEVRLALSEMYQRIVGPDGQVHILTVKRAIESHKEIKKLGPKNKNYCSKIGNPSGIRSVTRPPPGFSSMVPPPMVPPPMRFPMSPPMPPPMPPPQLQYDDDIFRNSGPNFNWMTSNPLPSPPLSLTPPAASPSSSFSTPSPSWNTYSLFPESDSTNFFTTSLSTTTRGNPLYNRK